MVKIYRQIYKVIDCNQQLGISFSSQIDLILQNFFDVFEKKKSKSITVKMFVQLSGNVFSII